MSNSSNIQHLVMRFADALCSGIDTIREHQQVLEDHGAVWLGKLGRPLAQNKIDQLSTQIDAGRKTFLYLVQKRGREYAWTRAALAGIDKSITAGDRHLVPSYYDEFGIKKSVSIWFKVTELRNTSRAEIRRIHVTSSGRPILETLPGSMAAMFMVRYGGPKGQMQPAYRPATKIDLHQAVLDVFEEED